MTDTDPNTPDDGIARTANDQEAQEASQRTAVLRYVRLTFLALVLVVTLLNVLNFGQGLEPGPAFFLARSFWIPVLVAATFAGLVVLLDITTPNKKLQTFGGVLFGLIVGMIISVALGFVLDLLATTWDIAADNPIIGLIQVVVGICICYLTVSTVLQTQNDFRLVIPYVEFAKQIRGQRPLVLDTSALIDARVADLGETGLLQAPLLAPAFVLDELQTMADEGDRHKRAKGRRGLEVLGRLQRSGRVDITIDETPVPAKAVDQQLVELARLNQAMLVTGDYALARIAQAQNIPVINMNEVANAMKPTFVVGEPITIEIIKQGDHENQGVGYLDDGTMVIVDDAEPFIGEEIDVTVKGTHQTAAGRLVFARLSQELTTNTTMAAAPVTPTHNGTTPHDEPEHAPPAHPEAESSDAGTKAPLPKGYRPPKHSTGPAPTNAPADPARTRSRRNPRR